MGDEQKNTRRKRVRLQLDLPEDLVRAIDEVAGPRSRREWAKKALTHYLAIHKEELFVTTPNGDRIPKTIL